MNNKILETLEFAKITEKLQKMAITAPAKKMAAKLLPSADFTQVERELSQTLTGANLLRIKGQMPLTDFMDVTPSTKRLRIKANLNAHELGNLLLVLTLANDINNFVADVDEEELDLSAIETILAELDVPDTLFNQLKKALDYDGEILDKIGRASCRERV